MTPNQGGKTNKKKRRREPAKDLEPKAQQPNLDW